MRLSAVSNQLSATHKFRKLEVWQKAMAFVTEIYRLTTKFPADERFGLSDQLRRAAISIALNIAEGCGTGSDLEFIRFLRIAQRSGYEVIAGLEIAINLKFLSQSEISRLISDCDSISAMIGALIRKIKNDQRKADSR